MSRLPVFVAALPLIIVMTLSACPSAPDLRGFPCGVDGECPRHLHCIRGVCADTDGNISSGDGGETETRPPDQRAPIDQLLEQAPCKSGQKRSCYEGPVGSSGKGQCKPGTRRCVNGRWSACDGQVLPREEVCDGQDNDCDGETDEGEPQPVKPVGDEVALCPGTFNIGSASGTFQDEDLQQVTLTHAFVIGVNEVTQAQFESLFKGFKFHFKGCGKSCPAESLTWHLALQYCNKLSSKRGLTPCFECTGGGLSVSCKLKKAYAGREGRDYYECPGYRLPTEAEWEYAARGGASGERYGDPDDIAWHKGNSSAPHPVGRKRANAFGMRDMLGNVWEWVWDGKGASRSKPATDPVGLPGAKERILKGGSFDSVTDHIRFAARLHLSPYRSDKGLGFRVARTLKPGK